MKCAHKMVSKKHSLFSCMILKSRIYIWTFWPIYNLCPFEHAMRNVITLERRFCDHIWREIILCGHHNNYTTLASIPSQPTQSMLLLLSGWHNRFQIKKCFQFTYKSRWPSACLSNPITIPISAILHTINRHFY